MPIVDSHIHVFGPDSAAYPWDPKSPIRPDFSAPVEDYVELMARAGVDQAVIIQHSCHGYDNRYIIDCVRRYPGKFCAVVKVDPFAPDAGAQLRALVEAHGVHGLRLQPAVDPAATWLNDPRTFSVWEAAADLKVVIGILLDPRQLPQAADVIRRFPEAPVVIDHMGRLSADSPPEAEPFQNLLRLARYPNVSVKVSAFYAFSRQPYPYPDMTPYVQPLWKTFGRERLMWATDYPLLVRAGENYENSRACLRYHLPELSADDQEWLMGRTASDVFRLAARS